MRGPTLPMQRVLSPVLGILMVVSSAPHRHWLTMGTAALAVAAVLFGFRWQQASTVAVVLTISTIAVSATPPVLAASSGLCATGYLVTYHLLGPNTVAPTRITAGIAIVMALSVAAVVVLPFEVRWPPFIAPMTLLAAFVLALSPYLRSLHRN